MSQCLASMPYEVMWIIIAHLGFDDIINLGRTCRKMYYIQNDERICRSISEVSSGINYIKHSHWQLNLIQIIKIFSTIKIVLIIGSFPSNQHILTTASNVKILFDNEDFF